MENTAKSNKNQHLFTVEIMIEESTNGQALEALMHILNNAKIQDFRILNGITLGQEIEAALKEHQTKNQPTTKSASAKTSDTPSSKSAGTSSSKADKKLLELFQEFKEKSELVRLSVVKAKGVKLSIPCRILNIDKDAETISVYHVDEKQVYLLKINEIDDYSIRH